MIVTNIDTVPGRRIVEHYGIVQGSTVRARHVGSDFAAGLKNMVGGELKGYTKLLEDSRGEALERLKQQALQLGANAIINVRFATSAISQGAAELMAYGTALNKTAWTPSHSPFAPQGKVRHRFCTQDSPDVAGHKWPYERLLHLETRFGHRFRRLWALQDSSSPRYAA